MNTAIHNNSLVAAQKAAHQSLRLAVPSFSGKAGGARKNDGDIFVGFMPPANILRVGDKIPRLVDTLEGEFLLTAKCDVDLKNISKLSTADLAKHFSLGVALELLTKAGCENDSFFETVQKNGGCHGALIILDEIDSGLIPKNIELSFLNQQMVISTGSAELLKEENPFYIGLQMLQAIANAGLTELYPANNILLTGAIAGPIKITNIDRNNLELGVKIGDQFSNFKLYFED